jgi:hypothetical protein
MNDDKFALPSENNGLPMMDGAWQAQNCILTGLLFLVTG